MVKQKKMFFNIFENVLKIKTLIDSIAQVHIPLSGTVGI